MRHQNYTETVIYITHMYVCMYIDWAGGQVVYIYIWCGQWSDTYGCLCTTSPTYLRKDRSKRAGSRDTTRLRMRFADADADTESNWVTIYICLVSITVAWITTIANYTILTRRDSRPYRYEFGFELGFVFFLSRWFNLQMKSDDAHWWWCR